MQILYDSVSENLQKLESAFLINFPNSKIVALEGRKLVTMIYNQLTNTADFRFLLLGQEEIRHFLQIPKMVVKSSKYEYPVEFIVPTNMESEIGPLGNTLETEFLKEELPIGLLKDDMRKGIIVTGTEPLEIFLTNTKIIYESEKKSVPYIIITSNKNYRRLADLIPSLKIFRMGKDISFEPFDTEGVLPENYISFFVEMLRMTLNYSDAMVAAVTNMLKDLYSGQDNKPNMAAIMAKLWNGILDPVVSPQERSEFNNIYKFIQNLNSGEATPLFVKTKYPIFEIIADTPAIIEMDVNDKRIRKFLILLILIKIITLSKYLNYRDFMVLIDEGDLVLGLQRANRDVSSDPIFSMLSWIEILRSNDIGLHVSVQYPSLILPQILNSYQNVFVHKTNSFDESQALRSILNMSFRPREEGTEYSEKRKYQYQYEYLRVLEEGHALIKRPDIKACFPMIFDYLDFDKTHLLGDEEIQHRLKMFYPDWDLGQIVMPEKSSLEREFHKYAEQVKNILLVASEYDELMYTAIQSSTLIEDSVLKTLLNNLVQLRYMIQSQEIMGFMRRNTYRITEKGLQKLLEYCHMKGEIMKEDYQSEMEKRGFNTG